MAAVTGFSGPGARTKAVGDSEARSQLYCQEIRKTLETRKAFKEPSLADTTSTQGYALALFACCELLRDLRGLGWVLTCCSHLLRTSSQHDTSH